MKKPKILILTNESKLGDAVGQINGYELLESTGEIDSCQSISFKNNIDPESSFNRVLTVLKESNWNCLVVFTPKNFPETESKFSKLLDAINGRPILYWEGDPWGYPGEKKPVTKQMSWWMSNSEIVFSTAVEPHFKLFNSLGAKNIYFMPNTYCHLYFKNEELHPPIGTYNLKDLIMIASNTAKIPFLTGSPGSSKRWELATRLHLSKTYSTSIYGKNWPKNWSNGYLPYKFQGEAIRNHKISVNWDNFDCYKDYSSDRLPISLISGRVHITTRHPGMNWAPDEETGLFQVEKPKLIFSTVSSLFDLGTENILRLGLEGHNWAKNRLSHRQAARYIISSYFSEVEKPLIDPWLNLPIWQK